jgi:hypothetical protein
MHWWPLQIPLGPKSLSPQCTLGADQVDAVMLDRSGVPSDCKVRTFLPTGLPR